jgi:serine/threonine-protein kinase
MDTKPFSGRYEIKRELGKGGMGTIYEAVQLSLNRRVAIKSLHVSLSADTAFVARFQREARAMARLDHENIIRIHDVVAEDTANYIVMEFFDATDLKQRMQHQTRFAPADALAIVGQAADALAYAHCHGIIHRDIKPANIMVSRSGQVKIADFGIAAATDEISVTLTGSIMGTPKYMSPEQARGEPLDGRADLFSLGMVLYEMLSGQTPYQGFSQTAVNARLTSEEEFALGFPPSVPIPLQEMTRSLLRKSKEARPPNADHLAQWIKANAPTLFLGPLDETALTSAETVLMTDQTVPAQIGHSTAKKTRSRKAAVLVPPPRRSVLWIVASCAAMLLLVAGFLLYRPSVGDVPPEPQAPENPIGHPLPPPPPPPPPKNVPLAVSPSLQDVKAAKEAMAAQNDIAALRSVLLQLQHRVSEARGIADDVDSEQCAPSIYQKGVAAAAKGGKGVTAGDEETDRGNIAEAKKQYQGAQIAFKGALALFAQGAEAARNAIRPETDKKQVDALLNQWQQGFELLDFDRLNQTSQISPRQSDIVRQLFARYTTIRLTMDTPVIAGNEAAGKVATVTATIQEVVKPDGSAVVPGPGWSQISLTLHKKNCRWGVIAW